MKERRHAREEGNCTTTVPALFWLAAGGSLLLFSSSFVILVGQYLVSVYCTTAAAGAAAAAHPDLPAAGFSAAPSPVPARRRRHMRHHRLHPHVPPPVPHVPEPDGRHERRPGAPRPVALHHVVERKVQLPVGGEHGGAVAEVVAAAGGLGERHLEWARPRVGSLASLGCRQAWAVNTQQRGGG